MSAVVVLLFAVVIVGSIMVHEAGHFLTARRYGMKAERFFFGFGPTLWSFRRGETEYGVKALPLGGFVKIAGMSRHEEIDPADEPRAFYNQPTWQRLVVLVSGSFTHFVLAAVLLFVAMAFFALPALEDGQPRLSATVAEVVEDAPAAAAGIRPGDRIVAVDGEPTSSFEQVRDVVAARPGERVELTFERDGATRTTTVTLAERVEDGERIGFVGIAPDGLVTERRTLGEAAVGVFVGEYSLPTQTVRAVAGFGEVLRLDNLAAWLQQADGETAPTAARPISVIGAGQAAVALAEVGLFSQTILLMALLQIVIGVLNMLPLPPFDGGHVAVALVESGVNAVRRWRGLDADWQVDPATLMPLTLAVLLLFGLFALTAFYVDIVNPVSGLIR